MDHLYLFISLALLFSLACFNMLYFYPFWFGKTTKPISDNYPQYFYFQIAPAILSSIGSINELHTALKTIDLGPDMELMLAMSPEGQKMLNTALDGLEGDNPVQTINDIRKNYSQIVLKINKKIEGNVFADAGYRYNVYLTWHPTDEGYRGMFQNELGDVTYLQFLLIPKGEAHG